MSAVDVSDGDLIVVSRVEWERLRAERDALRAIVEGREEPPMRDEIAAHGGPWLVLREPGEYDVVYSTLALMLRRQDVEHRGRPVRWWPLRDGRPCAWPVVEVSRG